MSLDGKIAAGHGPPSRLGSAADLARLMTLRRWADVLVVGAHTVRAINPPMGVRGAAPRVVIVSRHGAVPAACRALQAPPGAPPPIVATAYAPTPGAPLARGAAAGTLTHWHLNDGHGDVDIVRLLGQCASIGLGHVLVEGGGTLAGHVLRADRLDEIVLTIAPWALGGAQAPSLMDGPGLSHAHAHRYRLYKARKDGDELLLRYLRARSQV